MKIERQSIIDAIKNNDDTRLEELLEQSESLSYKGKLELIDMDILNNVASNGYKECLKLLLKYVQNFDTQDKVSLIHPYTISNIIRYCCDTEYIKLVLNVINDITPEKRKLI